ncbi:MAG: phosphate transport system regulatory protein PhoU [Oxalobacter sp.]|nr:MAG: phosphate transport system regulatory protein PhoU [Oxalobacter sp.]
MAQEHLSRRYDQDLEGIRSRVLQMGGLVEVQFHDAMTSLHEGTLELAEKVIQRDVEVNQLDVALDHICTQLIVRRQPAANDLRTVMATTKIVTDLERIGDEATKIARSAKNLQNRNVVIMNHYQTIRSIAETASGMLHDALDAFARLDRELAIRLIGRDVLIDREFSAMMLNLIDYMTQEPLTISASLDLLWIAKSIERIGDHATNVAEQVIYIVEGKDIRHTDYATVKTESEK